MAVATVTIRPSLPFAAFVEGKYVCDASPSLTYINCGFVPSRVEVINVTDKDVLTIWTSDMANGTAMTITTAAAAVASRPVWAVPVAARAPALASRVRAAAALGVLASSSLPVAVSPALALVLV